MTLLDIKKFADGVINNGATKTISNIISYVIVVIVGIIMLYPQVVYENYTKYQEKKHASAVEKRLEADPSIRAILNDITLDINSDRTFVCEFHNGTNNLAGLPFLYLDMKYEVVKLGVEHVDDEYNNFNLTRYQFIPYAIERSVWSGKTSDIAKIDDRFANNLLRDDVGYSSYILINSVTGTPLGVLGVAYIDEDHYNVSEIAINKALHQGAQKLAILLSDTNQ